MERLQDALRDARVRRPGGADLNALNPDPGPGPDPDPDPWALTLTPDRTLGSRQDMKTLQPNSVYVSTAISETALA